MTEITVNQAVQKIKELQEQTGKAWYFKANKGSIKLVCETHNN